MRFSAEFLPAGPNGAPEEANTLARIKIVIGNKIATDMRIAQQNAIVDHVIAPAYPLAETIAFRWWQTLYGRGRKTSLRALGSGFAYPNVQFSPTGNEQIEINCTPYDSENPKVQFVNFAHEFVSVLNCLDEFEKFITLVLDQLGLWAILQSPLHEQYDKIQASLDDEEELAFCKAAGAFGVDPYTCDDRAARLIEEASKLFDEDGLEEFLAGASETSGISSLEWLLTSEQRLGELTELPAIEDLRRRLGYRRSPTAPWSEGYASAKKVRKQLGLESSESIKTVENLAKILGNPRFKTADAGPADLRGVSHVVPGHARVIVNQAKFSETELFAVSRTIGDAIHFGSPKYSPVTRQGGTYRQRMGRAFAAEFLAPVEAVLEMQNDGWFEDDIAQHFGVADELIRRQIENADNSL